MSDNVNAVVNSKTAQSIVATNYNPLVDKLTSTEIKNKTVENYYNQIKNNFYLGVKAHYLIARDLFDAKSNLNNEDYQRLVEQCGFSGSTQRKYLAVGGDVRLMSLFWKGKLPMKWTNQYLLTQLTDNQFEKVKDKLDADTSASDIKKLADLPKADNERIENMLLTFLSVNIDKSKVSNVGRFKTILSKITKDLSKYPEIEIVDDKVDDVEIKISKYFEKQLKAQEKETKEKEVKQKKVA